MADIKSLEQRRQFYDKGAPYISEFFIFKAVSYNLRGLSTRLDLPPFGAYTSIVSSSLKTNIHWQGTQATQSEYGRCIMLSECLLAKA